MAYIHISESKEAVWDQIERLLIWENSVHPHLSNWVTVLPPPADLQKKLEIGQHYEYHWVF